MNMDNHYLSNIEFSDSNIGEVYDLLDFAENVSERVIHLEDTLFKTRIASYFGIVLSYLAIIGAIALWTILPSTFYVILAIFLLVAGIAGAGYVWTQKKLRWRTSKELDVELRILGDLLEMISSIKKPLEHQTGAVVQALINMRLRRIRLSDEHIF